MSFSGTGTFNINSAGQPVVAGTTITATAFNALTADLATGLSTCITKDGQQTVTANIPFANYRLTGVGAGTSGTDAANVAQVQGSASALVTVSGTDTLTGSMTPALTTYATGNQFAFVAANTNTTAVTLNIDGLGAKAVTRDGSTALVAGDIISGKAQLVVYDGTRFQLLNSPSFTDLKATTLAVSGATTLSSNVAIYAPVSGYALDVGNGGGGSYSVRLGGPLFFSGSATVSGATAVAVMNYESGSSATRFFVGDGTGYSFRFAKRVASTTTDLVTFSDSGNVTIAAPSSGIALTATGPAAGTSFRATDGTRVFDILHAASNVYIGTQTGDSLNFYTSGTTKVTIDTSGNLGIGTTSPSTKLDVSSSVGSTPGYNNATLKTTSTATAAVGAGSSIVFAGQTNNLSSTYAFAGIQGVKGSATAGDYSGSLLFFTQNSGGGSNLTEVARFDSTGNLLVGTTTSGGVNGATFDRSTNANFITWINNSAIDGATHASFRTAGTQVGYIATTSGVTVFSTTSDYRLKKFVAPVTGSGERIDALNPVEFDWKETGNRARGFFAHEFQEVYANSVTGDKDAIDADGKPVYQGMQAGTAEVIADLVAEIKSLRVRLNVLENK